MRHLLIFTLLLLFGNIAYSQTAKPIKWEISLTENETKIGGEIEIILKAEIKNNWYLYSSDFDPELGPTVTTINFEGSEGIKIESNLRPVGAKEKYDSLWEGKVRYFVATGEFRQKVIIVGFKPIIKAMIDYQVCSDKEGKCIPYEEKMLFDNIKVGGEVAPVTPDVKIEKDPKTVSTDTKNIEASLVPTSISIAERSDLLTLEKEKEKLVVKDKSGNDKAVKQLKDFTKKYGGK